MDLNKSELNFHAALTTKEIFILQLICEEFTSNQIANILGLKKSTVAVYRRRIKNKINAKNVAGFLVFAVVNRLYNIEDTDAHQYSILDDKN